MGDPFESGLSLIVAVVWALEGSAPGHDPLDSERLLSCFLVFNRTDLGCLSVQEVAINAKSEAAKNKTTIQIHFNAAQTLL